MQEKEKKHTTLIYRTKLGRDKYNMLKKSHHYYLTMNLKIRMGKWHWYSETGKNCQQLEITYTLDINIQHLSQISFISLKFYLFIFEFMIPKGRAPPLNPLMPRERRLKKLSCNSNCGVFFSLPKLLILI